jgi:drug/metabolite transporter (DMT)-like permease
MISPAAIGAVVIKLGVGGAQYVVNKIALDWPVKGKYVTDGKFGKNSFMTVATFLSMTLCVLPYFFIELRDFNRSRAAAGLKPAHPYSWRAYKLTLAPAILDVIAVIFSMFASKSVAPTLNVVLKSLRIVLSTVLAKLILGKPQKIHQWTGSLVVFISVFFISFEGYFRHEEEKKNGIKKDHGTSKKVKVPQWLAIVLMISGEILRAFRYLMEERLIKKEKLSVEFVVFMESIIGFGVALMVMIGANFVTSNTNSKWSVMHESSRETFEELSTHGWLLFFVFLQFFMVGISNYATTLVTKFLNSIINAILSQARSIVVWVPQVLLWKFGPKYYKRENGVDVKGKHMFGEECDHWSFLSWLSFIGTAVGALIYSGHIKVPGLYREESKEAPKTPSTCNEVIVKPGEMQA